VHKLGGDILNADPGRVQDLISLLQAVIKEDQEEIRIRMAFLPTSTRMPSRTRRLRLGHSNLCHVYSTSSNQVRHLRQTTLKRAKVSEEGKPGHEECFVAKIRLSQRNPAATDQFKLTQGYADVIIRLSCHSMCAEPTTGLQ
jgi:hypothetical protein